jgi:two-component system sensor histidine kinase VicK
VASNFLNLARLESGKFMLEVKPTELRALVRDTMSLFDAVITEKRIRVDLDFPEQVIPIRADPDCMKLVLNNLIGNAVKYTPPEGRITVRLTRQDVASEPTVTVSVEDTGIGFPMGESEDIFSGFHRTKEGRRMSAGTGIGLKVSRDMVEHHGSRLMAHSAPGKGSRFYFELPVCRECGKCEVCAVSPV